MKNLPQINPNFLASHGIVMIVDDTPENLALLSDTLSEAGYRVLVAMDGASALEQITYLRPDVILLDVMMPGLNGYETCHRLKSDPTTATIPVLFMTALGDLDDLLRGFGEGAVDYLVKPVRPPEVLARVEAQLAQARNIQRAENALNHGAYSALSVTDEGRISWLPVAGADWLRDFLQTPVPDAIKVGAALPPAILSWFKLQCKKPANTEYTVFEAMRGGAHFTAKMSACFNADEYLFMLEKHSGQWNINSVKNSLGLTFREAEILMWISRGKTNKEVGIILDTSPRTVNKHLEHVFEKLGVVTRAAAVSMVLQRTSGLELSFEEDAGKG